jgi:hypothetical protein
MDNFHLFELLPPAIAMVWLCAAGGVGCRATES